MSRFDLNLLRVLDTLMACRSVSETARRLHLSQSTVSHALARCREQLNDPLFVASRHGMQPTPRALAIAPAFRQALETVEQAVNDEAGFDPASSERRFTVAAGAYFDTLMLPHFMAELMQCAPRVSLGVRGLIGSDYERELEEGELDMVIGFVAPSQLSPRLQTRPFIEYPLSLLCRQQVDQPLTPQFLAQLAYVYPSEWGHSQLLTDKWFASHGISRDIRLQLPDFQSLPQVLVHTDLVATMPAPIASLYAEQFSLRSYPLDDGLTIKMVLAWHPRFAMDPGLKWLVDKVMAVKETLSQ
ncbi:LysR family transcriptional regulator [Oceanobacter sp. 3_MG-2023]|uniref:LysR family transcriptional regulator n=1 Tax=Oceanobacter sp. 3_MG-2023 TaxID=3062622 RepID=UPI0027353274|nr:LysR family transcriptional regulator [Oceanobacter sp. 3_MG-2023]MDP2507177.1 LysR family transcriptional regulator [Oceanobacter sp. 3_MG-2023]